VSTTLSTTFIGDDCIGRVIDGRYTLLRWLGGNDQSSVFLTELECDPPQKAAIRLIPAGEVDAEARLAQWAAAESITHPHLMRIFEAGRCGLAGEDCIFVVTEYADEILSEILRERPLSTAEATEMIEPLLEGLSFLHSAGFVHGHLKPSNIMVAGDRLKLSMDGLQLAGEAGCSQPPSDIYVAPEQPASGKVSPAADVWSLGVVLVEALTRQLPVRNGSKDRDIVLPESLPSTFTELVRKCLRVDPARRCRVADIGDALVAARGAETAGAGQARPARGRMVIAGMALVAVGMSVALVIGSHRGIWPPAMGTSSALAGQPPAPTPAPRPQPLAQQPASTAAAHIAPVARAHPAPVAQSQPSVAAQAQPSAPAAQSDQIPFAGSSSAAAKGSVVRGEVAYRAVPDVPQHISDGIQGHIRIRIVVQVDAGGNVADAAIDVPGPSQYFANKALKAAREWKFTPPRTDGQPVASSWALQFSFSQSEITVTPEETAP
jgi:eukaryotic-like serine/threonine-protein kinase